MVCAGLVSGDVVVLCEVEKFPWGLQWGRSPTAFYSEFKQFHNVPPLPQKNIYIRRKINIIRTWVKREIASCLKMCCRHLTVVYTIMAVVSGLLTHFLEYYKEKNVWVRNDNGTSHEVHNGSTCWERNQIESARIEDIQKKRERKTPLHLKMNNCYIPSIEKELSRKPREERGN